VLILGFLAGKENKTKNHSRYHREAFLPYIDDNKTNGWMTEYQPLLFMPEELRVLFYMDLLYTLKNCCAKRALISS
jgi:hypothetical protein